MGQLFVNLRGFDRTSPAEPAEMLGRLLRSLGVEGTNLPASLDERTELYRSILSKRRVLVVLDNAATDDQISHLIPGSQTCAVIANSRARLGSFGARRISLDVLGPQGATALVARLAGSERVDSDTPAVAELTRLCGYLPLAVRVAAGRLARKPHWSVRRLVDQLSDERMRLDHLSQGQLDVRASISLSFASLSPDARRLLRRLGDLDLSEAGPLVSAALLDSSLDHADQVLEEIYDAQLVDFSRRRTSIGARYRLHDLVRLFAKERAHYEEPSNHLSAARRRAFGWLTTIATAAHKRVFGGLELSGPPTKNRLEADVVDLFVTNATDWVDDERQVIAAAVRRAAQETHNEQCWHLACAVTMLLQLRGYYDDLAFILEEARTAAEESGDSRGLAATLFRIGTVCMDLQEHDRALACFGQAGHLFELVDDQHGYAL